jgi:hypothetical protein
VKEAIMRRNHSITPAVVATLALLSAAACDLDVPDLDNPPLDDLLDNPTPLTMTSACTGLQIANRRNRAQPNGYISQLGILGRESYNFDGADPRYINELLEGSLEKGSPFGGNFWAGPYASIRLANIIERAVEKIDDYSEQQKSAIRGFAATIEAIDLLEVAATHDTNGGVIDTDRELEQELAPLVGRDEMLAEIGRLLDEAATDLGRGGTAFPISLTSGFAGFETPANFLKFNRAIRARVAAYAKDYATVLTALTASFINQTPMSLRDLEAGVYQTYSIGAGDTFNGLINPNIYAHPSVQTGAMPGDDRFTRKVVVVPASAAGTAAGLSSNLKFTIYSGAGTPVPVIRNEELLLLRAEAKWFQGDKPGATADLNLVRTLSGGLAAITEPATDMAFITALLYERRYSLLFEGHRLIDVRRLDRVTDLPLDVPDVDDPPMHQRNVRYPIPQAECDARPGEPRCMLGSQ